MAYYSRSAGGSIRGRIGSNGPRLFPHLRNVITDDGGTGQAVTLFSTTFDNADTVPSWVDQEMAFGEAFAPGDVPAGTRLRAVIDGIPIPCQVSNRRVWTDGSLKVADIRVLIPTIPVGGSKTVTWQKVNGAWTSHDTALHTDPVAVTSKVSLEYAFPSWKGRTAANVLTAEKGPKIFRSNEMLSGGNAAWIDTIMTGPLCSEWRASDFAALGSVVNEFTSDFGGTDFNTGNAVKDTNFGALLYARAWGGTANNPKRIQFFYRTVQGWSTDIPADEQGSQVDANLIVNGVVVRGAAAGTTGWAGIKTWKGGFLTSAGTDGEMDWYDVATASFVTPPKVIYRRNITYGLTAKFIPPYDYDSTNFPMTAAAMTYTPGKRGPLRPVQDDVADAIMIPWTTSKPFAWTLAAHKRGTAAQVVGHMRYLRAAALGMGAMTSVALHRTTRKIISYLPPAKQTNAGVLGASIYGNGKPAQATGDLRPEITNLDAAHFPQMAFPVAFLDGAQHYLDLLYHECTLPGAFEDPNYGFNGTSTIGASTVQFGGISYRGQIRAASHTARPIGAAVGLGNPADPHWVMARDYLNHWAEMIERLPQEQDSFRGGLDRTDGRRFQDLKLLWPNNEPTYKLWMHTIGLGAMAYTFGISEATRMKDMAVWFAHAPTVLSGGWHNDNDPLMKPDPAETTGYHQVAMDGIAVNMQYPNTTGSPLTRWEYGRYWRYGQWQINIRDCTYLADGQTVTFTSAPVGSTVMLNGMIITVSAIRGAEPHWADSTKMPPLGLTPGTIYYSVQSSGLNCKLSLTPGGPPVTFTPLNGTNQAGHIFRAPIAGVHPTKPPSDVQQTRDAYYLQTKSALDMVQWYVLPNDNRVRLARQKLAAFKAGSTIPNDWDERAKTIVPLAAPSTPDLGPWSHAGAGSLGGGTDSSVIIVGSGTAETAAQRTVPVSQGDRYTLTFTTDKAITYTVTEV